MRPSRPEPNSQKAAGIGTDVKKTPDSELNTTPGSRLIDNLPVLLRSINEIPDPDCPCPVLPVRAAVICTFAPSDTVTETDKVVGDVKLCSETLSSPLPEHVGPEVMHAKLRNSGSVPGFSEPVTEPSIVKLAVTSVDVIPVGRVK
jgi:hypothetical protein